MAETSSIEWTDSTWNVITGCTLVSEGCRHCYAATLAAGRLQHHPSRKGLARVNAAGEAKFTGKVRFNEEWLDQPLRWRRPRMIFVCAHGDLFHENVPDEWIDRVFAVMALARRHTFQVLTKRPERARAYLSKDHEETDLFERIADAGARMMEDGDNTFDYLSGIDWPLPNVWLGTSVENQATADERIPHLLAAPAAVRFLSAEPLLGPIDLEAMPFADGDARHRWSATTGQALMYAESTAGGPNFTCRINKPIKPHIDWVIVGGESGRGARPLHPDWARSLRDQCAAARVAYFHKQNGAWEAVYDRDRDDPDWRRCDVVARDTPAGRWLNLAGGHGFHGDRVLRVVPVGKAAAGRLLDGVEHNGMPEGRHG